MGKAGGQLTRDDWASAALDALARGGLDAIAVEVVAARLGATKGSFYWHFKNRDALIDAALAMWEQRSTEAVIEHLEREGDPAQRLRIVLAGAFGRASRDRAEIALLATPDHPAALRAVRRAADRRIGYIAEQFELLGCDPAEALDRAVLAYYIFIGYMQMSHVAPRIVSAAHRRRHIELVLDALLEGESPTRPMAAGFERNTRAR